MSDGPHRTLPMRSHWKNAALRGQKTAFSTTDVADAVCRALVADFAGEVRPSFARMIAGDLGLADQASLFASDPGLLEKLRAQARSTMETSLLDCAVDAARRQLAGRDAMTDAIHACLEDRALSGARQVEEHYARQHHAGAAFVAGRIEAAIEEVGLPALAQSLASGAPVIPRVDPRKHDGIDDGMAL